MTPGSATPPSVRAVVWVALLALAGGCASAREQTPLRAGEDEPFPASRANEWVTIRDFRYVTAVAASRSLAYFGSTAGLERLDTLRDRWLAPLTAADGLPDDRITALVAEPSTGDVWIGTARGMARLIAFADVVEPVHGPPPIRVDRLLLDPRDGTVWARVGGLWWRGTNGSPVLERAEGPPTSGDLLGSASVDEVNPARLPWTDPYWVDSPLLRGARFRLTVLDRDDRGDWYVGTWGDNGRRWAAVAPYWEPLYYGLAGPSGGPIAASGSGYWFLPGTGGRSRAVADVSLAPGRTRIALDPGSPAPDAVARASRDLGTWSYAVPVETGGLPAAAARAALAIGDTLWLATDYGLVRGLDGAWARWGPRNAGPVAATVLASDGDVLWVGGDDGLAALDRVDGSEVRRFLAGRRVTAVAAAPEAVYAGTATGLYAAPRATGGLPDGIERVESRGVSIRALAVTDSLLLVAGETGLEAFDRRAGAWLAAGVGGGRSVEALDLAVDPDGQVWIGSATGLQRWRPATGEWDAWTPADGLAGVPVIHVLAEDGVVWASTPGGASRFAWREAGR